MAVEIRVPTLGESVVEATVGRWYKREGDPVAVGELLVGLETEKVNTEVSAEEAGVLERIEHREGETVHPGDVLGVIATTATQPARPAPTEPAAATAPSAPQPTEDGGHPRASSVAQRMAQELGVDLSRVPGSGPGGRVTREDVEAYARQAGAQPAAQPPAAPTAPAPSRAHPPARWLG